MTDLSPAWSLALLKTDANAWTTTHRLHAATLKPCIYGCNAKDELSHYLKCPVLDSAYKLC
eukprot:6595546-Alexandrium_andersonii.AAC.1